MQKDSGQPDRTVPAVHSNQGFLGLAIAVLIVIIWMICLREFLILTPFRLGCIGIVLGILWQTFLYTGLFVTAHDAMHGAICPTYPRVNSFIGTMVLLLYGLLPYRKLLKAHYQHHHYPATSLDPDFHDNNSQNIFLWYLHFVRRHGSRWSVLGLAVLYFLAHGLFQISNENLLLFWIGPSLLSSFQLFYFGTFLPHRELPGGYTNPFRTQTIKRPFIWSLISCYHFVYHYEHHQYPATPWWLLPTLISHDSPIGVAD